MVAAKTDLACPVLDTAGTCNVADAEPPTVAALLAAALEAAGLPVRIRWVPASLALAGAAGLEAAWRVGRRGGAPPLTRYVAARMASEHTLDTRAARVQLGWTPRHDRGTGLAAWAGARGPSRAAAG